MLFFLRNRHHRRGILLMRAVWFFVFVQSETPLGLQQQVVVVVTIVQKIIRVVVGFGCVRHGCFGFGFLQKNGGMVWR